MEASSKGIELRGIEVFRYLPTHSHADHSTGIVEAMKTGIDIYLLPETREALGLSGHRIHEIKLLHQFTIGNFAIKAFPVKHDVPNCGFLLANKEGERAVYITDTQYCPYRFENLHTIAIGCNFSEEIIKENVASGETDRYLKRRVMHAHMSLESLLEMLKANDLSKVREIWLLHGSSSNLDKEEAKRQVQEATGVPVYVA